LINIQFWQALLGTILSYRIEMRIAKE